MIGCGTSTRAEGARDGTAGLERSRAGLLSLVPSVGVGVLSKFTCALCLTAYAGVLNSLGLGVVATDGGLALVTAAMIAVNLVMFGWSARQHRRVGPFIGAIVGSVVILAARLWWPLPTIVYTGAAIVLVAAVWNVWATRHQAPSLVPLGRSRPARVDSN